MLYCKENIDKLGGYLYKQSYREIWFICDMLNLEPITNDSYDIQAYITAITNYCKIKENNFIKVIKLTNREL